MSTIKYKSIKIHYGIWVRLKKLSIETDLSLIKLIESLLDKKTNGEKNE